MVSCKYCTSAKKNQAVYGFPGGEATMCGTCRKKPEHEKNGFINRINTRLCIICGVGASFGLEKGKPLYCKTHKNEQIDPDMYINVVSSFCIECPADEESKPNETGKKNGKSRCVFGLDSVGKMTHCGKHAAEYNNNPANTEIMIDLSHENCEDCIHQLENDKNRKLEIGEEYIYIKPPRASYAIIGESTPRYCGKCQDMYNDVYDIHKKCITCLANINIFKTPLLKNLSAEQHSKLKRAKYGPDGKEMYCAEHKQDGMLDSSKRCLHCSKRPSFGKKGSTPILCVDCVKREEYVHEQAYLFNLNKKNCITPLCDISAASYDPYCLRCHVYTYSILTFNQKELDRVPDIKVKENEVLKIIELQYPNLTITNDKRIDRTCSLRRPDIYIDLGFRAIIIEIDEGEHRSYSQVCENRRVMELWQDSGHNHLVIIRFNPDSYTDEFGKYHPSCFTQTKTPKYNKNNTVDWKLRIKKLKETLDYYMDENNVVDKTVELVYLFYTMNSD